MSSETDLLDYTRDIKTEEEKLLEKRKRFRRFNFVLPAVYGVLNSFSVLRTKDLEGSGFYMEVGFSILSSYIFFTILGWVVGNILSLLFKRDIKKSLRADYFITMSIFVTCCLFIILMLFIKMMGLMGWLPTKPYR